MCTVTFIPIEGKYYLTSNRDEKILRKPAIPPKAYDSGDAKIVYPKDADAGGTWIAAHENGNAVVLLNGGFVKHLPAPSYRMSRGVILLDIIGDKDLLLKFHHVNLREIEPFTLVLFDKGNLYECRWDGTNKHTLQIDKTRPHIWSSVTLYDSAVIQKREQWFRKWLEKNAVPGLQDIVQFHLFAGEGDEYNDLRINRNGITLTLSTTSVEISNEKSTMHYYDLKTNKHYKQELSFSSSYSFQ